MSDSSEQFENWWSAEVGGRPMDVDFAKEIAKIAWQASRASIVVELPKTDLTGAIGIAHKAITKRCAEAITKTGVRVK